MRVLGGEALGRCLSHECGTLMDGIRALGKTPQRSSATSTRWGYSKKVLALSQEEGHHQNTVRLISWSWTSSFQSCEKYIYAVYKLRSLWYFVIELEQTMSHTSLGKESKGHFPGTNMLCWGWGERILKTRYKRSCFSLKISKKKKSGILLSKFSQGIKLNYISLLVTVPFLPIPAPKSVPPTASSSPSSLTSCLIWEAREKQVEK